MDDGNIEGGAANDQEAAPTRDELKEHLARCRRLVDWLDQEGHGPDDPTRIHASQQAEEAEKAWREAGLGVAVATRLLWSEKALRRAERIQASQEQAIDDFDRWYEDQRGAMLTHLASLRQRTREYEDRLAALSRQAAHEYQPSGMSKEGIPATVAMRDAVSTIEDSLAPAMREALQLALEGSDVRNKLAEAMGSISTLYTLTTHAAERAHADVYDIGDDANGEWGDGGGDDQGYSWWGGGHDRWFDDGAYGGQGGGSWQAGTAHGWDDGHGYGSGWGGDQGGAMDTSDIRVPQWMRNPRDDDGSAWGSRAWKRWKVDGADDGGLQGRHTLAEEITDEHVQALRLQAQHQDAAAAAAAATATVGSSGVSPTPPAQDLGAEALERRKQEIWDAAQDEGVQVTCAEIAGMSAQELEQWAAANITGICCAHGGPPMVHPL